MSEDQGDQRGISKNLGLFQLPTPGFTVEDVAGALKTAPIATSSWIFNLRDAGSNVAGTTCTIADAATTCTANPSAALPAGDLLDWIWTVTGTPVATVGCLSIAGTP